MVRNCAPENLEIPGSRWRAPRNDAGLVAPPISCLLQLAPNGGRRDFLIPHDGIRKLIDDHLPYLADGAISANTPINVAVRKGATRLIILPTGHACASQVPPVGAVANALHALTLLISRQLVSKIPGELRPHSD
jgi:hypothetical protein